MKRGLTGPYVTTSITLLLCTEGILREPLLYLSLYLRSHGDRYYALLDQVRGTGDRESGSSSSPTV